MSHRFHLSQLWPILVAALVLSACTTTVDRRLKLEQATRAILAAEESGAEDFVPESLSLARSRLAAAREAMSRGKHILASELAAQAEAEADLVKARSDVDYWNLAIEHKARRNDDLRRRLRDEDRR